MNQQPENSDDEENGPYKTASGRAAFFAGLTMEFTWAGLVVGDAEESTQKQRKQGFAGYIARMLEENESIPAATIIDEGWAVLPSCQWTAVFRSGPIDYDEDEDWDMHSALVVRWFTEELPKDFQQMLIDNIKKVNWEETAKDYSDIF